jgi:hypothetical protein
VWRRGRDLRFWKWGLAMTLETWFRGIGLDAEATNYAGRFNQAAIPDDETQLPEIGLTRDDLRQMQVKAGHFQTILDGIGNIERDGTNLADDRKDFVRRMIAVAISVGFAGRLVQMNWIKGTQFVWPTATEWIVLLRLVVGIFVVVSGWEWYHRDIRDRPLNRPWRFYIDIAVVITTILFLFASDKEEVWLSSLVLIFALYLLWDAFSALEFRTTAAQAQIWSAFVTNAMWLGFFIFLLIKRSNKPIATCLFVLLATLLLRASSGFRIPPALTLRGFLIRLIFVLGLAGLYHFLVPYYWP